MKESFTSVGIGRLCGLFGKTRHAYYNRQWYLKEKMEQNVIVLEMVHLLRREMSKLGTRKLYYMLNPFFREHEIKMGRDALHKLLQENGLLIQRKRRYAQTTYSNHWLRKYPNLIKDLEVTEAERLWVSDITYISLKDGFNYLSLITDAYSRKIVGYYLHKNLSNYGTLEALQQALISRKSSGTNLIHHSDRGVQYCSSQYIDLLKSNNIQISMAEKGSPYENAIAERVNGILKTEFGLGEIFKTHKEALEKTIRSIKTYNERRPHMSCGMLTPSIAHRTKGELIKAW